VSRRRISLVALAAACVGVALLLAAPGARASGLLGSGIGPNLGPNLNPLPSIAELLNAIVNGLFGALLSALTPSFLRHADVHTLEWLVALPNVADSSIWPTVGHLEGNMVWVAGAMLPTTLIIATTRDTALSLSFRAHPGNALLRVVGAVFVLVLYRFSVQNGVAFVNVLTHTMLSWPVVAQGLHRTVLVLFGGSVIFGVGGAFLGLLGLVALVFAICLFALKVLLLMVLAVLFVAGPLLIALTPLPTVGHLAQGWLLALVGVCLIPVGWCVIFATAGAISLDVTNLGGGAHIGSRVVGAFAALATFYIAFKWPLMVLGHVRGSLGGLGVRTGSASGGAGVVSDGALAVKAQRARASLQAAMLAGGRGVGLAAGALGAPRGGLAGLAGRQARPHLASAAAAGAIVLGAPRARPRPTGAGERIARAGNVLRDTPTRMRDAWRRGGRSFSASARAGNPGRNDRAGRPPRSTRSRKGQRAGGPSAPPGRGASSAGRGSDGSRNPRRRQVGPPVPASPAQGATQQIRDRDDADAPRAVTRDRLSAPAQPQGTGAGRSPAPPAQGGAGRQPRPAAAPSDSRAPRPPHPGPPSRPSAPNRARPNKRSRG
jgi:hypothetical protein